MREKKKTEKFVGNEREIERMINGTWLRTRRVEGEIK